MLNPWQPRTEVESAFDRAKLLHDRNPPKVPQYIWDGGALGSSQAWERNVHAALLVRADLVDLAYEYTQMPLDVFAQKVREWRSNRLSGKNNIKFPLDV